MIESSIIKTLDILVLSCDMYNDVWDPFFQNYFQKWPDCPFRVNLVTNEMEYAKYNVHSIKTGKYESWGKNISRACSQLTGMYVLTIFEDLFFSMKIDTDRIVHLVNRFITEDMNYLQLNYSSSHRPTLIDNDNIGVVLKGTAYRSSAVMTLWKKSILQELLISSENAWDFEVYGAERTNKHDKWFASVGYEMPFYNSIVKGKYHPQVIKKLKKDGIVFSNNRKVMNAREFAKYKLTILRSKIFKFLIPNRYRNQIRKRFGSF